MLFSLNFRLQSKSKIFYYRNFYVGTNGSVSFSASDFNAAYKEATGSSAPSNMTIVFQGVPNT